MWTRTGGTPLAGPPLHPSSSVRPALLSLGARHGARPSAQPCFFASPCNACWQPPLTHDHALPTSRRIVELLHKDEELMYEGDLLHMWQ